MFQKEVKSCWKTVEIYDKNKTCKSFNFVAFPYTPSLLLNFWPHIYYIYIYCFIVFICYIFLWNTMPKKYMYTKETEENEKKKNLEKSLPAYTRTHT
jgi:phosphotransferase system  glucose/maltose/N-acetylglucosamine-specific IIC component